MNYTECIEQARGRIGSKPLIATFTAIFYSS